MKLANKILGINETDEKQKKIDAIDALIELHKKTMKEPRFQVKETQDTFKEYIKNLNKMKTKLK